MFDIIVQVNNMQKQILVAERVLKKKQIVFENKTFTIDTRGPADLTPGNTVRVTGISPDTTKDTLVMFFENKKQSGGGEINTITHNQPEGMATITFKQHDGE